MAAAAVRSARTRRPHTRSVTWLSHVGHCLGLLRIPQDGKASTYSLSPIASDFGTGIRFEKDGAAEGDESYEVLIENGKATCSCKGHTYGGYCRHADAALALHQRDAL